MDKKSSMLDRTNASLENERVVSNIRKTYSKPRLEEIGDLRTITLGSSPFNTPDSDMTGLFVN